MGTHFYHCLFWHDSNRYSFIACLGKKKKKEAIPHIYLFWKKIWNLRKKNVKGKKARYSLKKLFFYFFFLWYFEGFFFFFFFCFFFFFFFFFLFLINFAKDHSFTSFYSTFHWEKEWKKLMKNEEKWRKRKEKKTKKINEKNLKCCTFILPKSFFDRGKGSGVEPFLFFFSFFDFLLDFLFINLMLSIFFSLWIRIVKEL